MDVKPIICLMGPTASGKTDIALELLTHLPLDIISVDSAMIYRTMNIGTAKPDIQTLKCAPHRLLDIRDPSETYSAGEFRRDALKEITAIHQCNRIPLLVGGTLLYFFMLQHGIAELPHANKDIRMYLAKQLERYGLASLYQSLQLIDPSSAERINHHDTQRILRALEIYEITGKTLTSFLKGQTKETLPYQIINLALLPQDRSSLHKLIELRFEGMLNAGFIGEVEQLYQRKDLSPDLPSLRSVGYRQIWDYLEGKSTFNEMKERGIAATRQLAKRQFTWLKRWESLYTFPSHQPESLKKILDILQRLFY